MYIESAAASLLRQWRGNSESGNRVQQRLPRFLSLELHSANSCVGSILDSSGLYIGNFFYICKSFLDGEN